MKIRLPIIIGLAVLILGSVAFGVMKAWPESTYQTKKISDQSNQPSTLPLHSKPGCGKISGVGRIDPDKIYDSIVVNQLLVNFSPNTPCGIVDEVITNVNGIIIGFLSGEGTIPDMYQIELPTSSKRELNRIIEILEKDYRVKSVGYHTMGKFH